MKKFVFVIVAVILLTTTAFATSNNITFATTAQTATFIMTRADLDSYYNDSTVKHYTFSVANLTVRTDKNCFYDFDLKSVEYRITANSFDVTFNYEDGSSKPLLTSRLDMRYTVTGDNITQISVPTYSGASLVCDSVKSGQMVFYTKNFGKFEIKDYKFTDVANSKMWYYNYVNGCGALGILNGMGDGSFAPQKTVTRAELASMIVRATEHIISYRTDDKISFTDVKKGKWYYENIMKCASVGIILGRGNGIFAPDDEATREEIATLVARVIKIAGSFNGQDLPAITDTSELKNLYPDGTSVSKFAKESVILCNKLAIMQGDKTGGFRPKDNTTRAECAKIFYVIKNSLN